jgi:hypothetical protein
MRKKSGVKYAGFGVLGVAAVLVFTFVVMRLWNWLVPEVFNGPILSYWQTLGLLVLSKILFSGIGGGSRGQKSSYVRKQRCNEDYPKSRWRQKYEAKMNGKVEGNDSGEKEEGDVIVTE